MKISVVIPALDEEREIRGAVESAGAPGVPGRDIAVEGAVDDTAVEVLVVDGGSRDATEERARQAGAVVLRSPPGRARQLEAGFRASAGDAILFLHADTRLPPGWERAVADALADPAVVGGAFRFAFSPEPADDPGRRGWMRARRIGLGLVQAGARLRVALFALPYGDQALFVRRAALEAIGGVPNAPVMEDLDLVAAMKERGRLALLPLEARTSPRRYRAAGVLRTFLRHLLALSAWRLGMDRERVSAWLRGGGARGVRP